MMRCKNFFQGLVVANILCWVLVFTVLRHGRSLCNLLKQGMFVCVQRGPLCPEQQPLYVA
jgi:hypothetical protein